MKGNRIEFTQPNGIQPNQLNPALQLPSYPAIHPIPIVNLDIRSFCYSSYPTPRCQISFPPPATGDGIDGWREWEVRVGIVGADLVVYSV